VFNYPKKHDYWYKGTESVSISLIKGKNHCETHYVSSQIIEKIDIIELFILFILIGIPLYNLLFFILIYILKLFKPNSHKIYQIEETSIFSHKILLLILLLGITVRIFYFNKFGIINFQHDWHGHIEFIKYMAQNWSLPVPTKGLEYPQQPVYYFISAGIYSLSTFMGYSQNIALEAIGYFSLFCSFIFLIYAYKFISLLSDNKRLKVIAMIFIAFTPSLVYISARINNDSLVMGLSAVSLYYLLKSYQNEFKHYFYHALILISLLFLTKISTLAIELLFFALLILSYKNSHSTSTSQIKSKLYIFGLVGIFLLTYTLWRVYLPLDNLFHMVNSSGNYPNQGIKELNWSYFTSYNFLSLFQVGYSYVFGEDAIRYSFLTYQYGTMLFGEFDYSYFIDKSPNLKIVMQSILLSGLVLLIGFFRFIIQIHKISIFEKLLFISLLINLILILKFIFDFPSICNTDFRYFVSSFLIFSFVFAKGIESISHIKIIRYITNALLFILVLAELLFFALLIFIQ